MKNLSEEIIQNKKDVLSLIQDEINEQRSYLNKWFKTRKQPIKDRTEIFEKEFEQYIEKKGIERIIKYKQDNTFKLLWIFFVGIFKRYK